MISKIKFENFKGFETIELTNLGLITLITGKNNSGKSSILDGVFFLMDHSSPDVFLKLNAFRGENHNVLSTKIWESLFYNYDKEREIKITAQGKEKTYRFSCLQDSSFVPPISDLKNSIANVLISSAKNPYTLAFEYTSGDYKEEGHFIVGDTGINCNIKTNLPNNLQEIMDTTCYINSNTAMNDNELISKISQMDLDGRKEEVIALLQIIDPKVKDIKILSPNGFSQVYITRDSITIPMRLAGDGMCRLLSIVLTMKTLKKSLILIDEIEIGFHYSMYSKLWEAIAKAASDNENQVIATTHSYECIVGARNGIPKDCDSKLFRIDSVDDRPIVKEYSKKLFEAAVDASMEVR